MRAGTGPAGPRGRVVQIHEEGSFMRKLIIAVLMALLMAAFGSAALAGDVLPGGSSVPTQMAGDVLPGGS